MSNDTFYLVDGNSLVYRSFYAIKLSTSKGFPTGAVYGFFNTLKKITQNYNPQYIVICFDVSRKTHRREKFKDYKIQRPPMPDALKMQIPIVKKLIAYLGIAAAEKEGYEADDIISSLARQAYKKGRNVLIVSSDKDMYQLIKDNTVCVYNPAKEVTYNYDLFRNEFGFSPEKIVDYLSLVGDSVDNVPGARGIGKVGALSLIKKFGTIEGIFNNLGSISDKTKNTLLKSKDDILLSKDLIKLEDCSGFKFDPDKFALKKPDHDAVYKLCAGLEFKTLLKDMVKPEFDFNVDLHKGMSAEWRDKINSQKLMIMFISGDFVYICDEVEGITREVKKSEVDSLLKDETIRKVSYDFKGILSFAAEGFVLRGIWFDVLIAAYLVNPALGDYSFENLCSYFLDIHVEKIPAAAFCSLIFKLYTYLRKEMEKNNLDGLFREAEMPLIEVLAEMEQAGVKIDKKALKILSDEVDNNIESVAGKIFKIANTTFNLNSPKQLSKVLFEDLKISPQKKTKTGFSTNEEVLEKLSSRFPIALLILDYRHLSKLKSTYLMPFMEEAKAKDSKLHAHFNQTGTQTGRLSSSSPNLQNIPVRGKIARRIRGVFISSFKEGVIVSSDYSQVELRVLAHFSQEESLIEAFKNNFDIHSYTASLLFGIKPKGIDKAKRGIAKRVNFGIIYGMSSYGLAKELKISEQEARIFIENYFARYPKVKAFIEKTVSQAERDGFVRTILGRRRYLPGINSSNLDLREFSRRQAVNTPIQGTAADLIKLAMIKIFRDFNNNNLYSKMIIQVHDELVFDTDKREIDKVIDIVKSNMESSLCLKVPLVANVRMGKNWLDLNYAGKR